MAQLREGVTLDDKYTETSGRLYLNGLQALVRIPLMQRRLDAARGLNTAAFISGYRGSPLGGLDMAFAAVRPLLEQHDVHFQPGLNEDLAATAVWGTQQLGLGPGAKRDGVIGLWYGKGPGVDRSADALKHANAAGSSKHGGVLALAGDDHACKSSTFPHQSEQALVHCMIPVLHPAGIADAMDLGLHGIAMSRYSGCWTGFKVVSDLADSSASVFTDPLSLAFKTPVDFDMPKEGLNIRWYDPPVAQEERLVNWKLPAAKAYARANGLDKMIIAPARKRLGIVAAGKAYMDTMQALALLGISPPRAAEMGIALYKPALTWPMEEQGIFALAQGAEEIFVVEEKRGLMEDQIRAILYNMEAARRPRVTGKTDERGAPLLPQHYELSPLQIAEALLKRLPAEGLDPAFTRHVEDARRSAAAKGRPAPAARTPWYCSGCPHNTSTVVPEGSRALAGIGCHYMAMWMDRSTVMFSQMGGEGVPWIGQAPFTDEKHIFANLGDGTYFHSGLLAIRAAVAAKVNITYKILYNDAVAMTGGQHVDGELSVLSLARQVDAENVRAIRIVTDEPWKYGKTKFPPGVTVHHRDELDKIQRELRDTPGTTVLIYDQTCAAEKRRRRKRGLMPDPAKRVIINERVCEGCGDCGAQSNCLSIAPVETEFGRKRQIDQSTCNKDFSCLKGFCPSFVTVLGGGLKKPAPAAAKTSEDPRFAALPLPATALKADETVSILVTGVGGTGVVTIGAILAMAAHLENKGVTTMDQTGLAQKGGAVTSHLRIASTPEDIHTVRLGAGDADVVLSCDMLVTSDGDALSRLRPPGAARGATRIVFNTNEAQTGEFTRKPDWKLPKAEAGQNISDAAGGENVLRVDATGLATALLGDSIAANMFMVGYAWQKGLIPLSDAAILKSIALNDAAVEMNQAAFVWGRRAAFAPEAVEEIAGRASSTGDWAAHRVPSRSLDDLIARRVADLTAYQSARYARAYAALVAKTREADVALTGKSGALTEAVARNLYKVMAYKDEYEVARLYTDGAFAKQISSSFTEGVNIQFHMAPPLLARKDEKGHLKKMTLSGRFVMPLLKTIAPLKILRGTPLDIFGYTAERREERALIASYKASLDSILPKLSAANYALAAEIADLPAQIRGYGHVKEKNLAQAKAREAELLKSFHSTN